MHLESASSSASGGAARIVPEAEFLGTAAAEVDRALFFARFGNWKLSVGGAIGISWVIAAMYLYLDPAANSLLWAGLQTVAFGLIGITCFVYERHRPAPESSAHRRWLNVWTATSGVCGAVTGSLPWFLPAARIEFQLSAAAIVSVLMIAFAVARAHRPLVYALVCAQTAAMCVALALHAKLYFAAPVLVLQAVFVLLFSYMLSKSMRDAIGQRLYAQQLMLQLRRSQARQLQVQQREATLNERHRMLGELQDGLGNQLLAAQRQLESGRVDTVAAATLLGECVADLRLMVGTDEPASRNLPTLLAMLRHRLQRRIQAAGIQFNWQIAELPDSGAFSGAQAVDLLRILQEAVSNVVQHAGAKQLSVVTRKTVREFEIAVEDDGQGFDPVEAMNLGRGIATMQRRAARLGATLLIEPRDAGGTALYLRLRLPLGGTPAVGTHGAAA